MSKKNSRKITYNKMVSGRKKKKTKSKRKHRVSKSGGGEYYRSAMNYFSRFLEGEPPAKPSRYNINFNTLYGRDKKYKMREKHEEKHIDLEMKQYILSNVIKKKPELLQNLWFASQSSLDVILSNEQINHRIPIIYDYDGQRYGPIKPSVKEWLESKRGKEWVNNRKKEEEKVIDKQMVDFMKQNQNPPQFVDIDRNQEWRTIPHPYTYDPKEAEKSFSVKEWLESEKGKKWLKTLNGERWMNTISLSHFSKCEEERSSLHSECLKIEIGENTWIKRIRDSWDEEWGDRTDTTWTIAQKA